MTDRPPPGWVNRAWWQAYGAHSPPTLTGDRWITDLATSWQLVRHPEVLTLLQKARQDIMVGLLTQTLARDLGPAPIQQGALTALLDVARDMCSPQRDRRTRMKS